jgi:hypothetical protein
MPVEIILVGPFLGALGLGHEPSKHWPGILSIFLELNKTEPHVGQTGRHDSPQHLTITGRALHNVRETMRTDRIVINLCANQKVINKAPGTKK